MTFGEFVNNVSEMRAWQRKYFRTRSQEALRESKRLEKAVDDMVKAWKEPPENDCQQELF